MSTLDIPPHHEYAGEPLVPPRAPSFRTAACGNGFRSRLRLSRFQRLCVCEPLGGQSPPPAATRLGPGLARISVRYRDPVPIFLATPERRADVRRRRLQA